MWPSKWLKIHDEGAELFTRCRGLRAEPWSFSTSHGQMLVRFYRPKSESGIYLYCKICEYVQFISLWDDADPKVETSQGQYGKIYTITDGDRLRIVCGAALIAEWPHFVRIPLPSI